MIKSKQQLATGNSCCGMVTAILLPLLLLLLLVMVISAHRLMHPLLRVQAMLYTSFLPSPFCPRPPNQNRGQSNMGGRFPSTTESWGFIQHDSETFLSPPFESIPVAEAVLRYVFVQLRAPPPPLIPTPLSLLPRNASVVQFCLTLCRSVLSDAGLFDSV